MITLTITIEETKDGNLRTQVNGSGDATELEINVATTIQEAVKDIGGVFGTLTNSKGQFFSLPIGSMPIVQN